MKVSKIDDAKLKELARISENLATDVFGQGQGWYVSGDSDDKPPMVWDGSGDAIVDQMQDGTPYFEPETAAFIAAANPETVGAMARELVELRAQNKWVKCSERLPKEVENGYRWVQVYDKYWETVYDASFDGEKWEPNNNREPEAEITHWRPLPASPEEEGK